jgi:AcrR family transcriptional regulator
MYATKADHEVPGRDSGDTRETLLTAAVGVVENARTSEVSIDEIAAAAGVDARAASDLYPSVDELLIGAALRMCAEDLRLATVEVPTVSAYARHFAGRRAFYQAMRIGPVAQKLDARMAELMAPLISMQIGTLVGAQMTEEAVRVMTREVTEEAFRITNGWIVESDESATAESLYVELEGIVLRRFENVRDLQRGERPAEH